MLDRKILIIIPAFNEGNGIDHVIRKIRELYYFIDVLVIDDGSSDDTRIKSKAAGAKVISHPFNMGYGIALQTGYKYAVLNNYEFVIQLDGDGQHDPECIKRFLEELKKNDADLILGSRFLGGVEYRIPFLRQIGMIFFRTVLSVLIHKRLTDPTTGFQALNKKAITICSKDIFPHDYPDADMLLALHLAGIRIREIPVKMYKPEQGKSMHQGLKPIYYMIKMVISIFITLFRPKGE